MPNESESEECYEVENIVVDTASELAKFQEAFRQIQEAIGERVSKKPEAWEVEDILDLIKQRNDALRRAMCSSVVIIHKEGRIEGAQLALNEELRLQIGRIINHGLEPCSMCKGVGSVAQCADCGWWGTDPKEVKEGKVFVYHFCPKCNEEVEWPGCVSCDNYGNQLVSSE